MGTLTPPGIQMYYFSCSSHPVVENQQEIVSLSHKLQFTNANALLVLVLFSEGRTSFSEWFKSLRAALIYKSVLLDLLQHKVCQQFIMYKECKNAT